MAALSAGERLAALAVLGLPAEASGEQITQAYRRLAMAAHPDITARTDAAAADRFTAINDAYRRLGSAPVQQVKAREESVVVRPGPRSTRPGRRPPIVAGPVTITPVCSGARDEK